MTGGRWTGWEAVQVRQSCWKGSVLTEVRDELRQMPRGRGREEVGLKRSWESRTGRTCKRPMWREMEKAKFMIRPGFLTWIEYLFIGGDRGRQRWTVVSPGGGPGKGKVLTAMCGIGAGMAERGAPSDSSKPSQAFWQTLLSHVPLFPSALEPSVSPLCHIMVPGSHEQLVKFSSEDESCWLPLTDLEV